jgi:hypothetical protein
MCQISYEISLFCLATIVARKKSHTLFTKKDCMKAFKFNYQWNFMPFFGLRKLRIFPKLDATERSFLISCQKDLV